MVVGAPVGVVIGAELALLLPVLTAVVMVAGQTVVLTMTVEVMIFWVRLAGQLGTDAAQLVIV
jgi:hypothetical protein